MIEVLYTKTESLKDSDVGRYLKNLPLFLQNEVLKYRFLDDRKLRLLGYLMLINSLKKDSCDYIIENWRRDSKSKPFIDNWKYFNISHSAKMVLFVQDSKEVGIDVEKMNRNLNYKELVSYLHKEEKQFILD